MPTDAKARDPLTRLTIDARVPQHVRRWFADLINGDFASEGQTIPQALPEIQADDSLAPIAAK